MENTLYIKEKTKIRKSFRSLAHLKNWVIIDSEFEHKWFIYEKGNLLFKIQCEFLNNAVIIKLFMPFVLDITASAEIMLRPLLFERDMREILKSDHFALQGDTIFINKNIKLPVKSRFFTATIINQINEMLLSNLNISMILQSKLDYITEIKLN